MSSHAQANRLITETSPYLRQHAYNPVDWYPWGPEAFAKAKAENKPILLSVGYSACHWCHVMAHESFESESIARMMNEAFVNVKVDREERPDVDEIYQRVTQLLTGHGGWPLTVFLDPALRPIYGGTYFPPEDRYGRPGLPRVLYAVIDAYRNRSEEARDGAQRLVERIQLFDQVQAGTAPPTADVFDKAVESLLLNFDSTYGGFGQAPKFPMVADQELLLARHRTTGIKEPLEAVLFTLQRMATGGIYDQLGGGFHRYSVDPYWLAPHFEKMLYDNALLPRLYLEAYRLTGEPGFARIVHETLQYLVREMQSPEGGFYSSQDADSEGEEGKFFVWSLEEIQRELGSGRAGRFAEVFDVTAQGNWEHKNILRIVKAPAEVAAKHGIDTETFERELREDAGKLLTVRERRPKPGRDDKQLAAWNGLTLTAFAQAGALLGHEPYLETARSIARFLWERLYDPAAGRMRRVYHGESRIDGFLDDYAYAAAGFLDLHRATGDPVWAERARELADVVLAKFRDAGGLLYLTPSDGEPLPSRPKSGFDQMLPSPAGVAVQVLYRLGVLTGDPKYRDAAEKSLACYASEIAQHPTAYAGMLAALDLYYRGETTCVIAGANNAKGHQLAQAARHLLPADEAVLVSARSQESDIGAHLMEGKSTPDGEPAAFVCRGFACMPPARTPQELADRIRER